MKLGKAYKARYSTIDLQYGSLLLDLNRVTYMLNMVYESLSLHEKEKLCQNHESGY